MTTISTTIRQGWYTLLVSAIITFSTNFATSVSAESCTGFRTQTQSDWGALPLKGNCAAYMCEKFSTVFPDGLTIGCHNKLVLNSTQAIIDLLPISGPIAMLPKGTITNPNNRKFTNSFAGQIVALKLNIAFDEADGFFSKTYSLLKNQVVCKGKFINRTVENVLAEAESLISGGFAMNNLYDLNEIITRINRNYMDGKETGSYLACPVAESACSVDKIAPVFNSCPKDINVLSASMCLPIAWSEPTVMDNCTSKPSLKSNFYSGACMPVGITTVTYTASDSAGNKSVCAFKVNVKFDPSVDGGALKSQKGTLDLNVQAEPRKAIISWVSKSTQEIDYFIVEKLDAAGEYNEVLTINSKNTSNMDFYTLSDENITEGENIYRVKAIMLDGSDNISTSKKIQFGGVDQIQVYPNPATEYVSVDLKGYEGKTVKMTLYNQLGQVEKSYTIDSATAEPFNIDVNSYKTGSYFLRVSAQGKRDVSKQIQVAH
jgi:HYR domain/Secretion system C-terminal sorting domain